MSPEELPRPKGPKVEPIDRRGKLMAFKQAVRKEAEEDIQVEAPANETPYERLKRLKTDSLAYRLQRLHLRRATRPRDIRGRSQTTIHHRWNGKSPRETPAYQEYIYRPQDQACRPKRRKEPEEAPQGASRPC